MRLKKYISCLCTNRLDDDIINFELLTLRQSRVSFKQIQNGIPYATQRITMGICLGPDTSIFHRLRLDFVRIVPPSSDGPGGDIEFFGNIAQRGIGACFEGQDDLNLVFVGVPLSLSLFGCVVVVVLGGFLFNRRGWIQNMSIHISHIIDARHGRLVPSIFILPTTESPFWHIELLGNLGQLGTGGSTIERIEDDRLLVLGVPLTLELGSIGISFSFPILCLPQELWKTRCRSNRLGRLVNSKKGIIGSEP